jgi:hypothetical protein
LKVLQTLGVPDPLVLHTDEIKLESKLHVVILTVDLIITYVSYEDDVLVLSTCESHVHIGLLTHGVPSTVA